MSVATALVDALRNAFEQLGPGGQHVVDGLRLVASLETEVKRIEQELALSDLFLGRRGTPAVMQPNPGWRLIADEFSDERGDADWNGPRVLLFYPEYFGLPAVVSMGHWSSDSTFRDRRPHWTSDIAMNGRLGANVRKRQPTHWRPEEGPDATP